jgi:hypothetical protein
MICAKHKITYVGICPSCAGETERKESNLIDKIGAKQYAAMKWVQNPRYDGGRRYRPEFRSKVQSALLFINKAYGPLLEKKKAADVDNALRRNLDDVFAVAGDDLEWTNVVHALGGQHGDKVYDQGGKLLGVMQSFGCTAYSRVDVKADDTKQASLDQNTTFMGIFDDSKRIYLHGKDVHLSTVTHELLHYFCHKNFYKAFADKDVGPEWKVINEGITEYLTRKAYTGDNHGSYEQEVQKVADLRTAGLTDQEIERAYFQGDIHALVEKMKAGEMKEENLGKVDPRMDFSGARGRRGGKGNTGGGTDV